MGDRANIVIEADRDMFPNPVFFYTHWSGSEIKPLLSAALQRGESRWNDPAYLARVIFCQLVKSDPDGITGFGISTAIGDGGKKLLCVNMKAQRVIERDSAEDIDAAPLQSWSFAEFAAQHEPEAAKA